MNKIIQQTFQDIKSLKIQGATAVAKAVVLSLNKFGIEIKENKIGEWQKQVRKAADCLLSARPTEPMAQNGVKIIFFGLRNIKPQNVMQAKKCLKEISAEFLAVLNKAAGLIVKNGQEVIKNNDNIFTHCHSWLVEQILIQAKKNKIIFKVFNTETRPLFQGRITSKKMIQAKIPITMVADSSAGFLISHYSGKKLEMDKIILGADAILSDGSVINKIGSFGIGVIAHEEKVPLYIAAPLLKFHNKSWIKIEKRSSKEIWSQAPKKLKVINFAFDKIPAEYITGIICETGIIKAKDVKKYTKKLYPYL